MIYENELSKHVLDVAIYIHKLYGPGLYESVYEELLSYELSKRGYHVERQKAIPLQHEEIRMDIGFRADLIIDDSVVVEIKAVEELKDVHYKQVNTYLKLTGLRLGLLINFNVSLLKDGYHRIANKL